MVAGATASSSFGNGGTAQSNNRPFRGISKEDDSRTQDGVPLCGRVNKWVTSVTSVNQTLVVATVVIGLVDEDLGTVGSVGDHTVGTDKEEKVIAEVNEVEEVGAKEVEVEDVCSLSVVQESVPEEKTDVMVIDAAEEKVGKEVFEVDKEAPVSTTFCEMAENTVDAKVVADPKVVETSKTVVVRSKVPVPKVKVLKSILKKSGGKSARVAVSISYRTNKIEIGGSVFLDWEDEDPDELPFRPWCLK
ncbi:hypothetical protein PC114_g21558 [Phytophthora cactorum]|nr:hypothetical protein PC114_g21558 [Phytophthora cactorum]